MKRVSLTCSFFLPLLLLLAVGCGKISSMLAEPAWTENYALQATCDIPEMNDSSMYTSGQTRPPEYIKGEKIEEGRFSEVNISFKDPKNVRRIVVRRRTEDTVAVDLNIEAMVSGEWKVVKEIRGADKSDIDIKLVTVTDKLKIKTQRATRTASGKSVIALSAKSTGGTGRRGPEVDRVLHEPIKIAEIEIYGIKGKEAPSKG